MDWTAVYSRWKDRPLRIECR